MSRTLCSTLSDPKFYYVFKRYLLKVCPILKTFYDTPQIPFINAPKVKSLDSLTQIFIWAHKELVLDKRFESESQRATVSTLFFLEFGSFSVPNDRQIFQKIKEIVLGII